MKIEKELKRMTFFAPDDGGGESAGMAVFNPAAKDSTGTGEPPSKAKTSTDDKGAAGAAPATTETPETTTTTTPAATTTTIDTKAFANEFGGVIAKELGKIKEGEKPKLTAEEAKKLLKVWEPGDDWYKKFDNLETRKDAVAEMRDALVGQADTITQHRLNELQSAIEAKFSPALELMQRMDTEQREARFDTVYPQLAKPGLKKMLHSVAEEYVKQGKTFNSETEMFDALASGMESIIKETNSDFKLEKASGSTPAKTTPANQIPVTTPGSGGGTGNRGGQDAPAKPRALAIWDK